MIKVLFVCSQNRLRSPTAEQVFSQYEGVACESAGTNDSAEIPLGPEQVEWADTIFAMEGTHRSRITKKFKRYLNGKRIIVLGIPDQYGYMDEALVRLLRIRVEPYLGNI